MACGALRPHAGGPASGTVNQNVAPAPTVASTPTCNAAKTAYVPDPYQAGIVVRIYEQVDQGIPQSEIARRLTAEGVPTRSQANGRGERRVGTEWNKDAISAIISHPAYSGDPAAYRYTWDTRYFTDPQTQTERMTTTRTLRSADKQVPLPESAYPPLVSRELAARCRARLAANAQEAARRNSEPEATLLRGGYIFCGPCGRPMTTRRYRRDGQPHWAYRCPTCTSSLYADQVDGPVWAHVERLATDEKVAQRALARWHAGEQHRLAHHAAQVTTARRTVAGLDGDVARLARAMTREDDPEFQDRLRLEWKAAVRRQEAAQEALDQLEAERDPVAAQMEDLRTWAANWQTKSPTYVEQRHDLYRLGLRVIVYPTAAAAQGYRRWYVRLRWPVGVQRAVPWEGVPEGMQPVPVVAGLLGAMAATPGEWVMPAEEAAAQRALDDLEAEAAADAAVIGPALADGTRSSYIGSASSL